MVLVCAMLVQKAELSVNRTIYTTESYTPNSTMYETSILNLLQHILFSIMWNRMNLAKICRYTICANFQFYSLS